MVGGSASSRVRMACNSRSSRCNANVATARGTPPTAGGALALLPYFFGASRTYHLCSASPVRTTHISSTTTDKIEDDTDRPFFRHLHVCRTTIAAHACAIGVRLYAGHNQSSLSPRQLCACPLSE